MKYFYVIISAILLSSCASTMKPIIPARETYITVSLDSVMEKEIGESLISKGDQERFKGMKVVSVPEKQLWQNDSYTYTVGDIYPLLAYTKEHDLYFNKSSISESKSYYKGTLYTTFSFYGIAVNKKDENRVVPFIRQTTNSMGGVLVKATKDFEAVPADYINIHCENCFKKEFVFNGKVGTSLKFMYREYVEDLARPAFTQELQYDLSESNIVGFKGLRIEVLSANNTKIKYKVLKAFD